MNITTIVSTYNAPEALLLCLQLLTTQRDRDFEIIVADDGSGPATHDVIAAVSGETTTPIGHVWHEDRGFRAAAIRNRAIAASSGDYLVFLDGDCLVLPDFVCVHRRLAEAACFVTGRRSNIGPQVTRRIMQAGPTASMDSRFVWLCRALRRQSTRPFHLLKAPLGPLRKRSPTAWRGVLSCNLAIWRRDLEAVNGFDERYVGYGGEDTDLVVRLLRAGVRRKRGDMASVVMHLHHPRRPGSPTNGPLLAEIFSTSRSRAVVGLAEAGAGEECHTTSPTIERRLGGVSPHRQLADTV